VSNTTTTTATKTSSTTKPTTIATTKTTTFLSNDYFSYGLNLNWDKLTLNKDPLEKTYRLVQVKPHFSAYNQQWYGLSISGIQGWVLKSHY
jgi:hypothetical protein